VIFVGKGLAPVVCCVWDRVHLVTCRSLSVDSQQNLPVYTYCMFSFPYNGCFNYFAPRPTQNQAEATRVNNTNAYSGGGPSNSIIERLTIGERIEYIGKMLTSTSFPEGNGENKGASKDSNGKGDESTHDPEDDSCVDNENTCAVCLAEFCGQDEIAVSNNAACTHRFHRLCIAEWLVKNGGCPVCRRPYLCSEVETEDPDATSNNTNADPPV
jgi:Ring finger domain